MGAIAFKEVKKGQKGYRDCQIVTESNWKCLINSTAQEEWNLTRPLILRLETGLILQSTKCSDLAWPKHQVNTLTF